MEEQLAYLAGLMDGEGTWSIQVNTREYKGKPNIHFNPRMTMTLKYGNEVLQELVDNFGGAIYENISSRDGMRRWSLGKTKSLIYATNLLLPYLRIKKNIGERFFEAMSYFPDRKARRYNNGRSWNKEGCIEVAKIARTLNPEKSQKSLMNLEDTLKMIDKIYV